MLSVNLCYSTDVKFGDLDRPYVHILGIGLELACNGGSCGAISFAFEKTPRISLSFKLVPVQYQGYENGLLKKLNCFLDKLKRQLFFKYLKNHSNDTK